MEDIHKAVETGDFTGLSDKIFWRVYAAYQDGQMHMLIKQQESYREKAKEVPEENRALPEEVCKLCGRSVLDEEGPCSGHDPREVDGEGAPPSL